MTTFTLILFFHVGAMASGNSNATTTLPNFASEQECLTAGEQSKKLVAGSVKQLEYVCVKQTKP